MAGQLERFEHTAHTRAVESSNLSPAIFCINFPVTRRKQPVFCIRDFDIKYPKFDILVGSFRLCLHKNCDIAPYLPGQRGQSSSGKDKRELNSKIHLAAAANEI